MAEGQISQVVAGESHTLALTDDGKVFAWGKGMFGRLGNGSNSDQFVPMEVKLKSTQDAIEPPHFSIIAVAAGAYHNLALTDNGMVWSWGYNVYGQLGHEDPDDSSPHPICTWEQSENLRRGVIAIGPERELIDEGGEQCNEMFKASKVTSVEAGGMMSCAIDKDGVLWMWGQCPGPAFEGSEQSYTLSAFGTPQVVAGLQGLFVVKVACGNEHVLAVVNGQCLQDESAGICFAWGSNTYGQLGLGHRESRAHPECVKALNKQDVGTLTDVSCGAYHSAVLTLIDAAEKVLSMKRMSMCWTFGMGDNGQLGHGSSESLALPRLVESLPGNEKIVAISCGLFHMGVVTEGGRVWTWGMERGLGLCPGIGPPGVGGGDYMFPVRVTGNERFDASNGTSLACGAAHSVLAVSAGDSLLWAWGRGQNGVLGTGHNFDSLTPCAVVWPPGNRDGTSVTAPDSGLHDKPSDVDLGPVQMEQVLALAQRENFALTTELTAIKQHCASHHVALYGLNVSGMRGALKELEIKIAKSSYDDLLCLDDFYRQARVQVKEALFQKKVEDHCKQFLKALKSEAKDQVA